MARYFQVIEIDCDSYINASGNDLDCCQEVVPTNNGVFVAIDDCQEDEICIPLDCFECNINEE